MNKEEEEKDIKLELNAEDLDKTKKIIEEQLGKLNINDTLVNVIPVIVEAALDKIDTIEVEGKRVRIKFK